MLDRRARSETSPHAHLKDEADFMARPRPARSRRCRSSKPRAENETPGYTGVSQGDAHLVDMIKTIQSSPDWKSTAIVITYDEFVGAWRPRASAP